MEIEEKENENNGPKAQMKGNVTGKNTIHPDANRIIVYPNTQGYVSYDEPEKGGVLIDSLYQTMINNENDEKILLRVKML